MEFPVAIYWHLIKINRLLLENTNVFYFFRALEYCLNVENMNLSAIRTIRVLRPLRAINRIPSKFAPFSPLYISQCERRGTFTHTSFSLPDSLYFMIDLFFCASFYSGVFCGFELFLSNKEIKCRTRGLHFNYII